MSQGAKNDRNDAQAIAVAVRQPQMRFVTPKLVDQQAMLAWHRARSGYIEERTALLNRIRGLLAEFGIWVGRSSSVLIRRIPELIEDEQLPALFRPILLHAQEHLRQIGQRIGIAFVMGAPVLYRCPLRYCIMRRHQEISTCLRRQRC
jgi:transposase